MNKNNLIVLLLTAAVYCISTGISYTLFAQSANDATTAGTPLAAQKGNNDYEALEFAGNEPKTEECPLNGAKYSKTQREWWESHRPLGVMIENHQDSRPQSGLSFADIVYEAVAEGGITRFLAVFHCQDAGIVGPVRSARVYFMDFISEYGEYPLYAHVGGANTPGPANAIGQIADLGWVGYNDINQFSVGFPTFRRDENRLGRPVATEHTMYSTTGRLWEVAEKREVVHEDKDGEAWNANFEAYTFKDDAGESNRPASQQVHVEFWENQANYTVDWVYNKQSNTYTRKNGGTNHNDRNTSKQIAAKNVVVLYMQESNANDGYENNAHLLYKTKGKGNAVIFMDGKQTKATWEKGSRTDRLKLLANGNEVALNRGSIWFQIVPLEGVVEVD